MKKIIYTTIILAGLFSCSGNQEQAETTETVSESSPPEEMVELDTNQVYAIKELKALYAQNWKGEAKGNAALDGKEVTIEGEVFGKGKKSKSADGKYTVYGAKIEFRVSEFADPDFGHDMECHFDAESVEKVTALEKGSKVKIKGTIEKQEVYIEPNLKYTVLTLKDCQLL